MKLHLKKRPPSSPRQQRGAALLILLALVVMAAGYTLLKRLNQTPSDMSRAGDTAAVLGEAKAALIGYALKSQVRPGELPCPDNNNSGNATCAGNATFRLPWKTLGLPDLRDSSGERLWYAVDPLFSGANGINGSTLATQTIDGAATRYVAVIIAPGKSLPGQTRSGGQQNNILRYLEADNANNDTVFVTAAAGDFNDQLVGITQDELMQAVERRVLKEVSASLKDYYDTKGYFPNPAAVNTVNCNNLVYTGAIPVNIAATCPAQASWVTPLPAWFSGPPNNNNWNETIWYVVSTDCVLPVISCGANLLTVRGTAAPDSNKKALLITGGAPLSPLQIRPATNINDLLDSNENKDGNTIFEALPISATSNDQVWVVAP
ncbi:MAG: hypothetical protein BMS9Abin09_0764 [Gammaproteobacteria bacterium]|nr:MAG: hypothetical protein BMS9Abin09_0764 [Gammaproteobacteria bacterium]